MGNPLHWLGEGGPPGTRHEVDSTKKPTVRWAFGSAFDDEGGLAARILKADGALYEQVHRVVNV